MTHSRTYCRLFVKLYDVLDSTILMTIIDCFDADTTEVVALARGVAELPCDVSSPDPDDPVRLVLWYRSDSSTPIYR